MASSHEEIENICCVGKFTKSECLKQCYTKTLVKNLIVLTDSPMEGQRTIKLRVGSDNIETIFLHHECNYLTYFISTTLNSKHSCDPLQKHKKNVCGWKLISLILSDYVFAVTNNLRLIPGLKLCKRCLECFESDEDFSQPQQASSNKENLFSDTLYFDSPMEKVYTPRRVISALSNASIISPVFELERSNSDRRLRICSDILDKVKRNVLGSGNLSSFNAIDYKELLDALREKVSHQIIKDQSYNFLIYPVHEGQINQKSK